MYPEQTELLLIGCFDIIYLDTEIQIKYVDTNSQTCWQKGILHAMSGTIFSICLTSATSAEFQLHQLPCDDGEKDARRERREQDRCKAKSDDEPGLACCDKFFDCAKSNCVEKSVDTQGTLSSWLEEYTETWRKRTQSRRAVEFSSVAKKCNNGREYEETRSGREGPGTPEFQRKSEEYEETRRIPKLRHRHTISIYLLPTYPHVRQRYGLSPGLRRRACSFIRHDPTQSSLTTLLLATCIEKVVYMKSGEELHNKVYQSPRSLRNTVLKPNLHHGRLDLSNLEARTSVDHQTKESEEYGKTRSEEFVETRSGNIDFRIPGLPHSTVQKEDEVRRETVKKLTDQFWNTPKSRIAEGRLRKEPKSSICLARRRRN